MNTEAGSMHIKTVIKNQLESNIIHMKKMIKTNIIHIKKLTF